MDLHLKKNGFLINGRSAIDKVSDITGLHVGKAASIYRDVSLTVVPLMEDLLLTGSTVAKLDSC